MDTYIERVENIIRVLKNVKDEDFDLGIWWDKEKMCGCAIGWATQDSYFVKQGFINTATGISYQNVWGMKAVAEFFDFQSSTRPQELFTYTGYQCADFSRISCRRQVIHKLQAFLLEKQALQGLENVSQSTIAPRMVAELVN